MQLAVSKQTDSSLAFTNLVYVNPADFAALKAQKPDYGANEDQLLVEYAWAGCRRTSAVFATAADPMVPPGKVALNGTQRDDAYVALDASVAARAFRQAAASTVVVQSVTVAVALRLPPADGAAAIELDGSKLEKLFAKAFKGHVLAIGQKLLLKLKKTLLLEVTGIDFADFDLVGGTTTGGGGGGDQSRGQYTPPSSEVCLERAKGASAGVRIVGGGGGGGGGSSKGGARNIFNKSFDFNQMGIGGLDTEFNTIFKRAFASRIFPEHIVEQLGIHHVRGMLLHGPPGCGKTLIARQIGKVLNAREPKIVNGPEILDKFVGGSEQKIRDLFEDAEKEQKAEGANSMLHIIIFDEFDAICRSRGSGGGGEGGGVGDSVVNQLLSKIDGVEAINNVLIIGMTNRKDMIDDAILRPGRLEVHVEIGLPDEEGRAQILDIHTAAMRQCTPKRLSAEAEARLGELATRTKNFSGAELGGLVRTATASAMDRCVNKEDMSVDTSALQVTFDDFEVALTEVQPKFGAPTADLEQHFSNGMVAWGSGYEDLSRSLGLAVSQVAGSEKTPLLSLLLEGDNCAGKTALAAHAAVQSGFPFVRFVSADALIGQGEAAKCHHIHKVFTDSYKSPLSVIILDDLERLIEYTPLGPRFSNLVLQTLLVLLKKPPPPPNRLLVLATTAIAHLLDDVQLVGAFNLKVHVPLLDPASAKRVLAGLVATKTELDEVAGHLQAPIALKQLLLITEMARTEEGALDPNRFFECVHTVQSAQN